MRILSFIRVTGRYAVFLAALGAVCALVSARSAYAQEIPWTASGGVVRLNPRGQLPPAVPEFIDTSLLFEEAHRRLAPMLKQQGRGASQRAPVQEETYSVGDRKKFWAIDFSKGVGFPYSQEEIEAECRAVGEYAYYFVEVEELSNVEEEHLQGLIAAFEDTTADSPRDPSKGIYEHDTEVFGAVPDVDDDVKIVILLTAIPQDPAAYAEFAGYFYGVNQSLEDPVDFGGGVKQRSNKTEMLYVNSKYISPDDPVAWSRIMSTVAHEFQHLIQYGNDPLEITAVNEGFSEYASYICGYGLRFYSNYVCQPNVDMFSWRKYRETTDDYPRVALWTYYLGYRLGDDFILAYATDELTGPAGLNSALSATGSPTFDDIYNDFITSLYLTGGSEGDDRFYTGSIVPWVEPMVHENLHPSVQRVAVEPYGAAVLRYWNAADMTLDFPDGIPSGITARVALKGDGLYQVSDVTSSGTVLTGLGTTYSEAGLVLTNGGGTRSQTFRISTTATQGDTGLVKYENGRPSLRFMLDPSWRVALRATPEVAPARIAGMWVFIMGTSNISVAVRTMAPNPSVPGTWMVNEEPVFTGDAVPAFDMEGWVYIPIPDIGGYTPAGTDYLVSMRMGDNAIGYTDLTRYAGRSFIRETPTGAWTPLRNYGYDDPLIPILGDWMFRAEFAYYDSTAPDVSVALLQHPLFPSQADVYVMGNEPLHPGRSSGTLTESGGSPVQLIFERTLGGFSIVDPAPVVLDAGQVTLDVEAFDRYGGLSDTASIPISVSRLGRGQPASLSVVGDRGAVTFDVPAGGHGPTTLVMTAYESAPAGLPGGPSEAESALGAPVVSLGPYGWMGPSNGSELRVPVRGVALPGEEYRYERWDGGEWIPVAGGVSVLGGHAVGHIPGGGWYRLARGGAPSLPGDSGLVELLSNAPNPFNPQTSIRFRISPRAAGQTVRLTVHNVRGQLVKILIDRPIWTGVHSVSWYGDDEAGRPVSSGIYLYRLETGGTVLTRKMLLLR